MSLIIEVQQKVILGEKKLVISKISGLIGGPYGNDLPTTYVAEEPYIKNDYTGEPFLYANSLGFGPRISLRPNIVYSIKAWKKILKEIKIAGKRLHEIRVKIRQLEETWNKTIVYEI